MRDIRSCVTTCQPSVNSHSWQPHNRPTVLNVFIFPGLTWVSVSFVVFCIAVFFCPQTTLRSRVKCTFIQRIIKRSLMFLSIFRQKSNGVFSWRLNMLRLSAGSPRLSGSEFQVDGSTTAKYLHCDYLMYTPCTLFSRLFLKSCCLTPFSLYLRSASYHRFQSPVILNSDV